MNVNEKIDQKYQDLCAQLGDRMLKKERLEGEIKTLRLDIEALEKLVPFIQALEPPKAQIEPQAV